MESNKRIGKFLQLKRKEFGVNQSEVAKLLKITQVQYSNYEIGKSEIGLRKLIKLSILLNFDLNEIGALFNVNEVNKI